MFINQINEIKKTLPSAGFEPTTSTTLHVHHSNQLSYDGAVAILPWIFPHDDHLSRVLHSRN